MSKPVRRAFTLIELLVVVTIIVVLLALLLPGMDRAMAITERAVCASQLHATGTALNSWAADHKWKLPESQPSYNKAASFGIYAVWASEVGGGPNWLDDSVMGRYRGHAVVAAQGYVSPKAFYCPSNTVENLKYDTYNESASVFEEFAYGRVGGWPSNNDPAASNYSLLWTGYHYRSCFDGNSRTTWRGPAPRRHAGWEPLMADVFSDPGRGVDTHHIEGYNVLAIGGSARFVEDPQRIVWGMNNGGEAYHSGEANYQLQQRVWEDFFTRR